jgi:hypothetical protein
MLHHEGAKDTKPNRRGVTRAEVSDHFVRPAVNGVPREKTALTAENAERAENSREADLGFGP